jgi:hypothetical protein
MNHTTKCCEECYDNLGHDTALGCFKKNCACHSVTCKCADKYPYRDEKNNIVCMCGKDCGDCFSEPVERCDKCSGPFLSHHWRHYSPREKKTYHTGCFEQYRFPSLLSQREAEVREEIAAKIETIREKAHNGEDVYADLVSLARGT